VVDEKGIVVNDTKNIFYGGFIDVFLVWRKNLKISLSNPFVNSP
jgi:hypothetical protein